MKAKMGLPLGPSGGETNVAVQRPTVNVKEAENAGEQARAAARPIENPPVRFSKHGTFGPEIDHHGIDSLWSK